MFCILAFVLAFRSGASREKEPHVLNRGATSTNSVSRELDKREGGILACSGRYGLA